MTLSEWAACHKGEVATEATSRQEIANLLGLSRNRISRVHNRFQSQAAEAAPDFPCQASACGI
jgi:hypothetical protein